MDAYTDLGYISPNKCERPLPEIPNDTKTQKSETDYVLDHEYITVIELENYYSLPKLPTISDETYNREPFDNPYDEKTSTGYTRKRRMKLILAITIATVIGITCSVFIVIAIKTKRDDNMEFSNATLQRTTYTIYTSTQIQTEFVRNITISNHTGNVSTIKAATASIKTTTPLVFPVTSSINMTATSMDFPKTTSFNTTAATQISATTKPTNATSTIMTFPTTTHSSKVNITTSLNKTRT